MSAPHEVAPAWVVAAAEKVGRLVRWQRVDTGCPTENHALALVWVQREGAELVGTEQALLVAADLHEGGNVSRALTVTEAVHMLAGPLEPRDEAKPPPGWHWAGVDGCRVSRGATLAHPRHSYDVAEAWKLYDAEHGYAPHAEGPLRAVHEVARDPAAMYEQLVEMRGGVSWNHLTGLWHASANLPHDEFGSTSGCYASADTPEAAVAEAHAEWVRLGRPHSDKSTKEQRECVRRWADEREENEKRGAALRDLQTGSGELGTAQREHDVSEAYAAGVVAPPVPAAGEGTSVDPVASLKPVSDAEAEAAADSLCGSPVESATSRVFVGKGPERLAKRFPIMGGRRG